MNIQRRKLLKTIVKAYLLLLSSVPKSLGFSGARMRKNRRIPPGPLLTTQLMVILSAATNSKTLRTSQTVLSVSGKDMAKTQRTTQVMKIVAGNSI